MALLLVAPSFGASRLTHSLPERTGPGWFDLNTLSPVVPTIPLENVELQGQNFFDWQAGTFKAPFLHEL